MGCCVSIGRRDFEVTPTAKVVAVNGDLREYNLPVVVSQVLEAEAAVSSSRSSNFICNSESLNYDDLIPAMKSDQQLQRDQIYFVLPVSKRQSRLTASDMAALAVKASVAIGKSAGQGSRRRRKKGRISPVMVATESNDQIAFNKSDKICMASETTAYNGKSVNRTVPSKPAGFSRTGSVRRFQRYTSNRAKRAVRSFRLRLSTIDEGSVL